MKTVAVIFGLIFLVYLVAWLGSLLTWRPASRPCS